ncbi:hypothetical protein COO60DRAFT_1705544 [Scenedesmus sp. NREL 46B-D3]|nr:hypothetical protein COO60DRAFT_1705544 [Scenedesmus sp. NREL 46B-D3]
MSVEPEQQQQQQQQQGGDVPRVSRNSATVRRRSQERIHMAEGPELDTFAQSLAWQLAQRQALQQEKEQQLQDKQQQVSEASFRIQQLKTEKIAKAAIIAELLGRSGSSDKRQLVGAHSAGSSRARTSGHGFGTAVDREAAAVATMAAANSAVALAAEATVASADCFPWLYDQESVQPLQDPDMLMVDLLVAAAPGAAPKYIHVQHPLLAPTELVRTPPWFKAAPHGDGASESYVPLPRSTQVEPSPTPPSLKYAYEAAVNQQKRLRQQRLQQQQPQQQVQPGVAEVHFSFRCVTQPGERLWLVGDDGSLGSWDAAAAVKLKWSEGHIWSVTLPFKQGTKVAYKAVLQRGGSDPKHWRWQASANCVVEARSTSRNSKPLKVKHDFH